MFAALLLASAVSQADKCTTVPECAAIAERDPATFSRNLRMLLASSAVPLSALLDGWDFRAATPAITERIHEVLLETYESSEVYDNAGRKDLKRLLDFALARARNGEKFAEAFLHSVVIHLSVPKYADLLVTCAGPDRIGRYCALWAGKAGRSEKVVADEIWAAFLDEETRDFPLFDAAAGCAPVVARFRMSMQEHRAKNEAIRPRDASLLVRIDEPWSWKMLRAWVDAPDPERARPVVSVLLEGNMFAPVPDNEVREAALWRSVRDGALQLRMQALRSFGDPRSRFHFTDAQKQELLTIAGSSREAGRLLSPLLARSAHALPGASEIVTKTLFSSSSESLTRNEGKGALKIGDLDMSQSDAWAAVNQTPESTCWLTAPLRQWLSDETFDPRDGNTSYLLGHAAEWVEARWETKVVSDVGTAVYGASSHRFVCGTGLMEAAREAQADAAAFGLKEPAPVRVPAREPAAGDRATDERTAEEKSLEYARQLRDALLRTLATHPKAAVRCEGFAPMSEAHRNPRPRAEGTAPTLDLPPFPGIAQASVTLTGPDGSEIAVAPAAAPPMAYATTFPRRLDGWWRGPGRYQIAVPGPREPKPIIREFVVGEDEVSCVLRTGPWADAVSIECARRAPAAVVVKVNATLEKLELTLTNGTSDTLVPANGSWARAWSFSPDRSGSAPASIYARASDEQPLEGKSSRTWTYTFRKRPLEPVDWRAQVSYVVGGSEAAFVTDPVDFSLSALDEGPGATRAFVVANGGTLAIRRNRVVKLVDRKASVVVDPGVPLTVLASDAEGRNVVAAGAVTLLSTDGGLTFQPLAVPDDSPAIAAVFADASLLLFLENGAVLRRDGGSWKSLGALRTTARRFAFSDAQHGVLLDTAGHALATNDGGSTWSALELPPGEARSIAIDGDEVWLATGAGLYLRCADAKWTLADPHPCRDVAARGGIVSAACDVPLARLPGVPLGSRKFPEIGTTWRFADVHGGQALMTGDHGTLFIGDKPFGFTLEKMPNRARTALPPSLVSDEPDPPAGRE